MRRVNVMCLVAVLLTAGFANADTVWNPTDANSLAAGYTNWNIAANWTNKVPDVSMVLNTGKAIWNVANRH